MPMKTNGFRLSMILQEPRDVLSWVVAMCCWTSSWTARIGPASLGRRPCPQRTLLALLAMAVIGCWSVLLADGYWLFHWKRGPFSSFTLWSGRFNIFGGSFFSRMTPGRFTWPRRIWSFWDNDTELVDPRMGRTMHQLQEIPWNPLRIPAIIASAGAFRALRWHCLRWQIFAQPSHVSHRNRVNLASLRENSHHSPFCRLVQQCPTKYPACEHVLCLRACGSWCLYVR